MAAREVSPSESGSAFLDLYDLALPQIYGYLVSRCGDAVLAEDLTSETFLAAVKTVKQEGAQAINPAWLVGVARHKLVDHWRRQGREDRKLSLAHGDQLDAEDPWEEQLDITAAHLVLAQLGAHHRAVLSLRYLDGLSVPEVAQQMGRSVHATESLLGRARRAFRSAYGDRRRDSHA